MAEARSTSLVAAATVVLCLATACVQARQYSVVGTDRAPSADGVVEVRPIEGGNLFVTVRIDGLAPAARLGEGLQAYMVWFKGRQGPTVLAGVLEYDPETRHGTMAATTLMRRFELQITAERSLSVTQPGDVVVARRRLEGH